MGSLRNCKVGRQSNLCHVWGEIYMWWKCAIWEMVATCNNLIFLNLSYISNKNNNTRGLQRVCKYHLGGHNLRRGYQIFKLNLSFLRLVTRLVIFYIQKLQFLQFLNFSDICWNLKIFVKIMLKMFCQNYRDYYIICIIFQSALNLFIYFINLLPFFVVFYSREIAYRLSTE